MGPRHDRRGPTPRDGRTGPHVAVLSVGWPMETFIERLLTGLSSRGLAITLVSRGRPPSSWLQRHGIGWSHGPDHLTARRTASQVRRNGAAATARALLDERVLRHDPLGAADVVYAPWINTLTDRPHLLRVGPPVVTSCRGSQITVTPWTPGRDAHRDQLPIVFGAVAAVHCVSEAIRDEAEAFGLVPGTATVIRPAVDPATFRPAAPRPPGPLRLVTVGSLTWKKNVAHALTALRLALDRGVDADLTVIGDGPDRQHLRYLVDDLRLEDRVAFAGRRSPEDVADALGRSDVLVHTSWTEGISNAVLEAMACGLPVVATDVGGMSEAVRDGVDGFLVDVREPAGTAEALVRLAGDDELRRSMGAAARERVVRDFDLDDQVDAFAALLTRVASR